MPSGKYYCDYCDKQFQDTHFARRRHLLSSQHLRARAIWYDSFKDPYVGSALQSEGGLAKGVCHHFVRTGCCKFGDSCKYFHPKQGGQGSIPGMSSGEMAPPPVFMGNQPLVGLPLSGNAIRDPVGIALAGLPPSLRPPPEGSYPTLPFVDWG